MLTKNDKWKLFLSSYLPLYILIIVKDYKFFENMIINVFDFFTGNDVIPSSVGLYQWCFFVGVLILVWISVYTILWFVFVPSNKRYTVVGEFEKSGDSIISYIVTYVVPLLSMEIKNANSVLTNLILFALIGVLYVSQDLIYLNPILALLGYNFYMNGNNIVLTRFSTEKLREIQESGYTVKGNRLGSELFIYRKIIKPKSNHEIND